VSFKDLNFKFLPNILDQVQARKIRWAKLIHVVRGQSGGMWNWFSGYAGGRT
jgi:hypothetical protein